MSTYFKWTPLEAPVRQLWRLVEGIRPSKYTVDTVEATLRYRNRLLSARAGDEWTKTQHPGFLIIPQNQNRTFANLTLTPANWLILSNDTSIQVQNTFPAVALPNTPTAAQGFGGDIAGLPLNFQRRGRYYTDAASATMRFVQGWDLGLGYSYQQNDLTSYMAFQNDSSTNYVVDEPNVPYKQLSQVSRVVALVLFANMPVAFVAGAMMRLHGFSPILESFTVHTHTFFGLRFC